MYRRVTRGLIGACAATGMALALGLNASPASAQIASPAASSPAGSVSPASSLDGLISQAEVISRGDDWTKHHFAYNQSKYQIDRDHDYSYRLDCSGYANMMLHSKSNFNTDDFAHHADVGRAFKWNTSVKTSSPSTINPSTVHTGDLFDDTSDGHMFVFGKWASDGKSFTYYSFGTGYTDTDVKKTGHPGDSYLGGWPRSHYRVIRYSRVTS